jgi:DNA-binding transcriptional ArsR family regulator
MQPRLPAPEPTEREILLNRIEELEAELKEVREKFEAERDTRLTMLRNSPEVQKLYAMLLTLFHEAPNGATSVAGVESLQPQDEAKWRMWKDRLPGSADKVIDALLVSPLTATQLIAATKSSYSTVQRALDVLKSNGLTEKDGDRIRLKRI